jgi:hypothetical protein
VKNGVRYPEVACASSVAPSTRFAIGGSTTNFRIAWASRNRPTFTVARGLIPPSYQPASGRAVVAVAGRALPAPT